MLQICLARAGRRIFFVVVTVHKIESEFEDLDQATHLRLKYSSIQPDRQISKIINSFTKNFRHKQIIDDKRMKILSRSKAQQLFHHSQTRSPKNFFTFLQHDNNF